MKKLLSLLLALVMVFALTACGQQTAPAEKTADVPTDVPADAPADVPADEPVEADPMTEPQDAKLVNRKVSMPPKPSTTRPALPAFLATYLPAFFNVDLIDSLIRVAQLKSAAGFPRFAAAYACWILRFCIFRESGLEE